MKKLLLSVLFLSFVGFLRVSAQEITITGKVTDAGDGSELPGVNVTLKNTNQGTITNVDGSYRLSLPQGRDTLIFSFIGYQSQEVLIGGRSVINIQLAE